MFNQNFIIMKIKTSELQELFKLMEEKNFSITEVISFIQGKNKITKVELKPLVKEFDLVVDYSRTVREMVNAGNYDWINSDITEKNFPLPTELSGKKISMSSKLFHFNKDISSEDAIFEIKKAGYYPATLAELLALGENHPELQREFPIVGLGSVLYNVIDFKPVPVICSNDNERKLSLPWLDREWSDDYLFLGGCK